MAYNQKLADRIRLALSHIPKVEEKKMFRGITFMVDGKMCVSVSGEEMMCRFDPMLHAMVKKKKYFRPMVMKGKEYVGYGYVSQQGIKSRKEFDYWISLCLEFNSRAKASSTKKKKNT